MSVRTASGDEGRSLATENMIFEGRNRKKRDRSVWMDLWTMSHEKNSAIKIDLQSQGDTEMERDCVTTKTTREEKGKDFEENIRADEVGARPKEEEMVGGGRM